MVWFAVSEFVFFCTATAEIAAGGGGCSILNRGNFYKDILSEEPLTTGIWLRPPFSPQTFMEELKVWGRDLRIITSIRLCRQVLYYYLNKQWTYICWRKMSDPLWYWIVNLNYVKTHKNGMKRGTWLGFTNQQKFNLHKHRPTQEHVSYTEHNSCIFIM